MVPGAVGRLGRLVASLAVGVAGLLLAAAPASAHSETVRADPPNGGMVPEGRTSLTLWFDEPIGTVGSSFQLRTLDGLEVESSVDFENGADTIVVRTAPLARGQYVLDWHALSLVDGHASSGTIVFGAGLRPDVIASAGAGAPPVDLLVLRWFDLGALLLALGALSVNGRVLGAAGEGASRMRDRVRGMGVLATWVAVYAGLATPFLRTRSTGAGASEWVTQTWLMLTRTEWGQLWLVRELALVAAAVAMTRWRRDRGRSFLAPRLAMAALVVAVLLQSWGGHAAALPTGSLADAAMGAAHVIAAGVWVGGLAVLAITLVPRLRRAGSPTGSRLAVWQAYSPMAAVSSVVLMATGLYQAGHHVPELDSLRTTVYGAAVGAKLVLVALALALAGLNTLLVNPRIADRVAVVTGLRLRSTGPRALARSVTAEVLVLSTAVLVAAVLTSVPTAREVAVATRPAAQQVASVDGLFMTFESVPEGTGHTRLILRMRSTIQPEPAPVEGVDVQLVGPAQSDLVRLTPIEEGRYEGSTNALGPGSWSGTVSVHRAGLPDSVMLSDWRVAPPAAALASPLRTVSTAIAGLLLAGLATALILLRRRRTPPSDPRPSHPTLVRSAR